MQSDSYWQGQLTRRLNRRRLLLGGAGAAAGAAFLAACGGGSSGSSSGSNGAAASDKTSLIAKPVDTTSSAQKGGTLVATRNQDVFTFDGQASLIGGIGSATIYNRLVKLKPGVLNPPDLSFVGDLFESWEFSPDKLTMTAKLRNTTWHNLAPVNGRKVDGGDIVTGWQRWTKVGSTRGNYSTDINPDAPIQSVSSPDASTVVLKLSQPVSTLLGLLATANAGMYFMPREADQGYDPRSTGIGSTAWFISNFTPSASLTYRRHDGYWDAAHAFIDEVKEVIVPEYATAISQFRTGALHVYPVRQEDVLATKKDVSALQMYLTDPPTQYGIWRFGWNPAKKTPFRDQRLRQALSMSIDRDLWMDTFYNLSTFKQGGIDLPAYLHTSIQANNAGVFSGSDSYWISPRDKDFGPNAQYYQYNVADAKKLVQAASGGSGTVDTVANYPLMPGYGDPFIKQMQVFLDMAKAVGLNIASNNPNFNVDFRPQFADSPGDFDGVTTRFRPAGGIYDPVEVAVYEYIPNAGNGYSGFFADGGTWKQGDTKITTLLRAARNEFDDKKRISMLRDFQRLDAATQYQASFPGTASGLQLAWPGVKNIGVYREAGGIGLSLTGDPAYSRINVWLDQTQAPFKA